MKLIGPCKCVSFVGVIAAVRIQFPSRPTLELDRPGCKDRDVFGAEYSDREGGRKDRQSSTRMSNIHDTDDDNRE